MTECQISVDVSSCLKPDSAPDDIIRKKYPKISYIRKEVEEGGVSLSINMTS